jgi:hypothetical protein
MAPVVSAGVAAIHHIDEAGFEVVRSEKRREHGNQGMDNVTAWIFLPPHRVPGKFPVSGFQRQRPGPSRFMPRIPQERVVAGWRIRRCGWKREASGRPV